jgi:hypothetical protein
VGVVWIYERWSNSRHNKRKLKVLVIQPAGSARPQVALKTCIHAVQKLTVTKPVHIWPALSVGSLVWWQEPPLTSVLSHFTTVQTLFHLTPWFLKWCAVLRNTMQLPTIQRILKPSRYMSHQITLRVSVDTGIACYSMPGASNNNGRPWQKLQTLKHHDYVFDFLLLVSAI